MVNGGIRLQEVLASCWIQANTTRGADDPLSDCLPKVVRVTDGKHDIANMRYTFVINRDRR